jgi:hypothetical protein
MAQPLRRLLGGWMRVRWLWVVAVLLWLMGMIALVLPGNANAAGVAFGDVQFSFGQVCILLAVGAAWGEQRASNRETSRRVTKLEEHVFKN